MAIPIKRRKLFYPIGEQILGLLTKGKEWMLNETRKEYKGPYHRFTDGVVMTGGSPSKRSLYLIPYKDLSSKQSQAADIYRSLTSVKVDKFIVPKYYFPKVRAKDITDGYITRYFVQKKNDRSSATIMEIDKKQYDKVAQKNKVAINGKLSDKFLLRWKLTGTEEDITQINQTTLSRLDKTYTGIYAYLGNFIELTKYSPIISD